MNRIVAIVGPTGVGKSQIAVRLAQKFDGEIVGADSRQVYHYLDVGTAKPTLEERSLVPHHLIDVINPDQDFSLAQYQQLAYRSIADIQQRQKLPLLVGGTGLYVWTVLDGWEIPRVAPDIEFRRQLEERAAHGETTALYEELAHLDPTTARKIDPRNVRRVIRALEVSRKAPVPFFQLQKKHAPPFETMIIGLSTERAELYRHIDSRVDRMIEAGFVEEVKKLVGMGYSLDLPAMSGIGYQQIVSYIKGEITLDAAIQQIKNETHRFVRHQYNWFRLRDGRIRWFDVAEGQTEGKIAAEVGAFISPQATAIPGIALSQDNIVQ